MANETPHRTTVFLIPSHSKKRLTFSSLNKYPKVSHHKATGNESLGERKVSSYRVYIEHPSHSLMYTYISKVTRNKITPIS